MKDNTSVRSLQSPNSKSEPTSKVEVLRRERRRRERFEAMVRLAIRQHHREWLKD